MQKTMHEQHAQKFGKDRACGQTDRQTDTHTQTYSLQYFATAPAGKEMTTKRKM